MNIRHLKRCLSYLFKTIARGVLVVGTLVLSGGFAFAQVTPAPLQLRIDSIEWAPKSADPVVAREVTVYGADFDNGYWPPTVTLDGFRLSVDLGASVADMIVASLDDDALDSLIDELPGEFHLEVKSGDETENIDEFCFNFDSNDEIVECVEHESAEGYDFGYRQSIWRVPQGPEGLWTTVLMWKFGPTSINDKLNKWGDPVFYQLMHNYSIVLQDYLENYDKNYFDDVLLSRCQIPLENNLLPALKALDLSWDPDPNNPRTSGGFLAVSGGVLSVGKGYRWDGPSLASRYRVFKYPDSNPMYTRIAAKPTSLIRATLVHDALYDLMRLGLMARTFYNRKLADCLFYMFARQDNMAKSKARSSFSFIRLGGWTRNDDPMPEWKAHAVADAGEDRTVACALDTGSFVELDGSDSFYARNWVWTDASGVELGRNEKQTVLLLPQMAPYTITLTVDDGDDFDDPTLPNDPNDNNDGPFQDSDEVMITVIADNEPPDLSAGFVRLGSGDDDDDGMRLRVALSAVDDCDPAPSVLAELLVSGWPSPVPVRNGDIVVLKHDGQEAKVRSRTKRNGQTIHRIKAQSVNLRVTAEDAQGNLATAQVPVPSSDDDDEDDG